MSKLEAKPSHELPAKEILLRLERIETLLTEVAAKQPKVLYDWHDLKAQGIGEREAYGILRRYNGPKVKGRRQRITHEQLMDYYKRKE